MNLIIQSTGRQIGYDQLISVTLRTDLIPVPLTLEFSLLLDDELEKRITENAIILVGEALHRLTIIKVSSLRQQINRDGKLLKSAACIAVLTGCENLMSPLERAVILDECSMASAYRASGCKTPFGADIPLVEFVALYGSRMTNEVAQRCKEESAVICYRNKRLNALRLRELFIGEPVLTFDPSEIQWVSNAKTEQAHIQELVSLNNDGSTIEFTNSSRSLSASYYPRSDARRLKNMQTVLITRGAIIRQLSMNLQAGDLVRVSDRKLVILTAAHRLDTGAMGGPSQSISKFWFAELNQ